MRSTSRAAAARKLPLIAMFLALIVPAHHAFAEDEEEEAPVGNKSTAEGMGSTDDDGAGSVAELEEGESPRAAGNPNAGKLAAAETERKRRINIALPRLRALRTAIAGGKTPDAATIAAVRSWWWLGPTQLPTVAQMDQALRLIERNLSQHATVNVYTDPVSVRCQGDPAGDGAGGNNFACATMDGTNKIYLRKLLMDNNANCQAGVLTHEYFHLVGLNHAGGDACNTQRSMEDVLGNNNCMGGVICEVAGVSNCSYPCN